MQKGGRAIRTELDPIGGRPISLSGHTTNDRPAGALRILMANAPRSYRESIAMFIVQLRPQVEMMTVEPAALNDSISRFVPDMVVCSEATSTLRKRVLVWVELYPEHAARSVASIGGEKTEFAEIQLPDLLSIVDRAEELTLGPASPM